MVNVSTWIVINKLYLMVFILMNMLVWVLDLFSQHWISLRMMIKKDKQL